jgi:predicted transcriptional regulator
LATVLGSLFVVLGMGMATIHFSLALSSLTREWLPSEATPVVVLPRQRARLLFEEQRRWRPSDRLTIGVTYLGLRGGDPAFRVEVMVDGDLHRIETRATGSWDLLGPTGLASLQIDRLAERRRRGLSLVLEVGDANPQSVRLKTTSSLRTRVEGAWDPSGLSLAGVLELADPEAELVGWIMRQGDVTLSEVASHAGEDEAAVRVRLRSLIEQGLVQETDGGSGYTARLAARRERALPQVFWDAPSQGQGPKTPGGAERGSSVWRGVRRVLLGRRGRFALGAAPVFVSFAVTEWMLLTGSGSFAGLVGFIGVVVVSLVGGIFPVLLLRASRRKGDYVPMVVRRALGHPVLLAGLYLLFLGGLLLHGLVIWKAPWLRAGAVLVAAGIVVMTVRMVRNGTFRPRLNIEVREDQGQGRSFFAVTANGREATSHITLQYGDGARHLQTAAGEIPAFSSLRHAVFQPILADRAQATPRDLRVRVHRVTPQGDSEAIGGSMTVQSGGETKRFDIELTKGEVIVPVTNATCRVDIELTEIRDAKAQERA